MAEAGEPLTERELEVVRLLATGVSNKEIAGALTVSPNTVKVHLRNIFIKLEAESRTAVTMTAVRNGWVSGARSP
ncbi:MAG: response regulator transcription factor, partial [Thermoflexales bacterium]